MDIAPRLTLRARKPGDPEPDLTSTVVIHRAILRDLGRVAAHCDEISGGELPPVKSRAICRYTAALLDEIRGHCENEEHILWPLIAATAGQAVDLTLLTDDHSAIATAARRARHALAVLETDARPGTLAALRASASQLRQLLDEHFADEQEQIFPAARRYLPAAAGRWYEKQVQRDRGRPGLWFTAPWLARHVRPDEASRLAAARGWRARMLLAAARPAYALLDRRAFGSGPVACPVQASFAPFVTKSANSHKEEER